MQTHGTAVALIRYVKQRSPRRTGITIFEAGISASFLALAGGALLLWLGPRASAENSEAALRDAAAILDAVERFRHDEEGCPTLSALAHDRVLHRDARLDDPWGTRFRVVCTDTSVRVLSAGQDGKFGTSDDLSVPRS